jgi:hypothetical protein
VLASLGPWNITTGLFLLDKTLTVTDGGLVIDPEVETSGRRRRRAGDQRAPEPAGCLVSTRKQVVGLGRAAHI